MKRALTLLSAVAAAALFTGCDENINTTTTTNTNAASTKNALKEIKIPTINVSGVVQDKSGNPIEGHKIYAQNQVATTNAAGIFLITGIEAKSGVDVNSTGSHLSFKSEVNNGNTVSVVIPNVKNSDGNVTTHLGATATILIDDYLTSLYTLNGDTYYTNLDGKTIDAGVIQIPELGATVKGRLEDSVTENALSGTIYATYADEEISKSNGLELNATVATAGIPNNKFTVLSYNQWVFSDTVDANESGAFMLSNLPMFSTFDLHLAGYEVNAAKIATFDNKVAKEVGDVAMTANTQQGDAGAPQFTGIAGAYGDQGYTKTTNLTATTFVQPTTTLELQFNENLDTTIIDANSIRYVRTYTPEYLEAQTTYATAVDANTSANTQQFGTIDTYLAAYQVFRNYLNTESSDKNVSATAFKTAHNTYMAALKVVVDEANATHGNDLLTTIPLIDSATKTVGTINGTTGKFANSAEQNATYTENGNTTFNANNFGTRARVNLPLGVAVTTAKGDRDAVKENVYVNQTVSGVTASNNSVTITLGATLPNANIATVGLVMFDFKDTAGNLLADDGTTADFDITYVRTISVGTAQ